MRGALAPFSYLVLYSSKVRALRVGSSQSNKYKTGLKILKTIEEVQIDFFHAWIIFFLSFQNKIFNFETDHRNMW